MLLRVHTPMAMRSASLRSRLHPSTFPSTIQPLRIFRPFTIKLLNHPSPSPSPSSIPHPPTHLFPQSLLLHHPPKPHLRSPILSLTRPISTTTSLTPPSPPPPTTTTTTLTPPNPPLPDPLPWNRFLHLRSIRRRYNLLASLLTATATTTLGFSLLSQQDLDQLSSLLFGLDPIMALILSVAGAAAAGWLVGPFAGNAAFRIWYRRFGREMASKEKEFYQRIKRYRADPSNQSVANPLPDYYGEKIDSVRSYRQWLKDQRAHTKKRQL